MQDEELVEQGKGTIELTSKGNSLAETAVRRHRPSRSAIVNCAASQTSSQLLVMTSIAMVIIHEVALTVRT